MVAIDEFDQVIKKSSQGKKININITRNISDANAWYAKDSKIVMPGFLMIATVATIVIVAVAAIDIREKRD